MLGRSGPAVKSPEQIQVMRRAGALVGETLELVRESIRAGMTTAELDELAERHIRAAGGVPSFIGVPGGPGAIDFPASLCISVNDQVVHGIPGQRVIADGDLVSIDCGAIVDGWHGDAAISVLVGPAPTVEDVALVAATEQSMWHGIAALRVGSRLYDVGAAVEDYVVGLASSSAPSGSSSPSGQPGHPYGIVEDYVGHGIGRSMHEDPQVPNYRVRTRGPKVAAGLCVAVEPMLTAGSADTRTLADGWTVVTEDGGRAAHWEHSVAVTARGPWVLTALDGGAAGLASVGSAPGGLD
ncbi:MAG: methionyl aminopeptidase [Actinomycetota bacterium]|nr:methionyl aminopeptidase [Actinomycetota bacterium]